MSGFRCEIAVTELITSSMTFARQQMFIALAAILRKYDLYRGQEGPTLELYDTIRERDIDLNREFIIPFPAKGSHGLRVRVRS